MPVGSTLYWLLTDHPSAVLRTGLGSTAITTNGSGSRTAELRYKAWGETRYTYGTTPTAYKFTGQRLDDSTGLYYYGARYYDPVLGRFISADTLVPEPGNPQALNRYAYGLNNPLKYTDPTGHWFESALDIISIGIDIYDIRQNGLNWENGLSLVADVASLALPVVTGGGLIVRAATHADDVVDAVRGVNQVSNVVQAVNQANNAADAASVLSHADDLGDAVRAVKPDFYVRPNGEVVPAVGYRYSKGEQFVAAVENGALPSKKEGMYFSFDRYESSALAKDRLQLPYAPEYGVSFDTLPIIDDIHVPRGRWGQAEHLEPIAKDFPEWGTGGGTQAITYSPIPVSRDRLWRLR